MFGGRIHVMNCVYRIQIARAKQQSAIQLWTPIWVNDVFSYHLLECLTGTRAFAFQPLEAVWLGVHKLVLERTRTCSGSVRYFIWFGSSMFSFGEKL